MEKGCHEIPEQVSRKERCFCGRTGALLRDPREFYQSVSILHLLIILTASWRQYQNKPQPSVPSPISLQRLLHSFTWSQNTEKRNNTISQMRLRSVFKMRTSILNTATTEQMGYGIISFFVCFSLNEFQILSTFFIEHMDCISAKCERDFTSD